MITFHFQLDIQEATDLLNLIDNNIKNYLNELEFLRKEKKLENKLIIKAVKTEIRYWLKIRNKIFKYSE